MFDVSNFRNAAGELLGHKSLPVVLALIAGTAAGGMSFTKEHAKLGQKPIGFSEIGQTRRCIEQYPKFQTEDMCGKIAIKYGGPITRMPALTEYWSSINDSYMMIAEANNIARTQWLNPGKFAYELDKKVNPQLKVHTQITDYNNRIHRLATSARQTLAPWAKVEKEIVPFMSILDQSWDAYHTDVTHTESSQSCDSKGNCTTTYRTVYDYTIHEYTYHPEKAREAVEALQNFLARNPDIRIPERLITTWHTNAEDEMAMRDSRRYLPDYKDPREIDYLRWANTWASGSNFGTYEDEIYATHGGLYHELDKLRRALSTAHSQKYITYSSSDDGPSEYQIAQTTHENAGTMHYDIHRTLYGIDTAESELPDLTDKIKSYVDSKLHAGKTVGYNGGDILHEADEIYTTNFAGGFKVNLANWWMVAVWSALGAAVGAGAGIGINKLANRDDDAGYGRASMRPGSSSRYQRYGL